MTDVTEKLERLQTKIEHAAELASKLARRGLAVDAANLRVVEAHLHEFVNRAEGRLSSATVVESEPASEPVPEPNDATPEPAPEPEPVAAKTTRRRSTRS